MRVQVNLSDGMVERVDSYAKLMGVSRSALCSMLIGQGVMNFEKSMEMMKQNKKHSQFPDRLSALVNVR